ncbi:LysR family transcriptional regulator [Bacillus inaquosorum]|uniref:LysR family transcriptional regulator n=1 Tax=Bacillus rugosus TaxID=2715209 RepID=A0ACD3ZUW0_9BACI|nr:MULTISPECIES: LysR family transcriptional regulator [Bacillus]QJC89409.1 LysR family transcriptional regulator, YvbU like [Bacillus subtilis]MBY4604694.1 LysR family transcriptional regulator [Bacillus sp. SPARC3]MEC2063217.1 LysR family transcriptional regulator [Bacillus inaquosorum]MEC2083912.1 LysR family transcriptional regulator [Bacillus inaquosorum]QYX42149.1 LysR family transcriptional regulator [Bacillus inaquosorum]
MNRSQIQLIVKISETGSFTKAGEELHMTQPAVSRAVATIESQLGTKLIKRNKKNGLFFTDVGERVLINFRNILGELQKVDELIAAEQGLEIGKVHIGAYPTACTRFIPKIIRTMEDKYPGLEVKISEGSVDQVKEWLRSKSVDVGMIIPPVEDFDIVPLTKDQLIVIMHSSNPLYQKETIGIPDLQDEDIIIGRGGYEVQIHSLFKDFKLKPKVRFVIDYIDTALCMVQEGLGITITTKKNILSLPENVVFRELKPNTFREIGIAVPDMKDISKATDVFIQTARTLFANESD